MTLTTQEIDAIIKDDKISLRPDGNLNVFQQDANLDTIRANKPEIIARIKEIAALRMRFHSLCSRFFVVVCIRVLPILIR
jgi:hypothetical protein